MHEDSESERAVESGIRDVEKQCGSSGGSAWLCAIGIRTIELPYLVTQH